MDSTQRFHRPLMRVHHDSNVRPITSPTRAREARGMQLGYLFPSYIGSYNEGSLVVGGAERHFLSLTRALSKTIEVRAISFGKRRETITESNLVLDLYPAVYLNRFVNGLSNPFNHQIFSTLLSSDVVQVQGIRHDLTLATAVLARLRSKPLVLKDEGWNGLSVSRILSPVHFASVIACQSRRELLEYGSKGRLCYDGVDIDFFAPDPSAIRRDFVFVGRIVPHKGLEYLIDAARLSGYKVKIIGPGTEEPYGRQLRLRVEDAPVEFVGYLPDEMLRYELQRALALISPYVSISASGRISRNPELFGLSSLEAMSCSTPVICSESGGPAELVKEFDCGLLVSQGSASGLATAMHELATDPERAASLGANGRVAAESQLSWSAVAARYLALYAELTSKSKFCHLGSKEN